ncbi:MAG: sulfotransferase [Phycisphaerales bacterium]|nr:sulfotransferase [Phycisphaerales bacterium]
MATSTSTQASDASTDPPVLIAGRQHSGNTVLTVLLGRMPGWYGQSEESTLLEQHRLIDGISDLAARGRKLVEAIGLEDPDQAAWLDAFVDRRWNEQPELPALSLWREAMDGVSARRGDERWAQKGTSYIFYGREILDAWPDVRLIYMLRNPWDLVASRRRRNPRMEAVASTLISWAKGLKLARALSASHPDRFRMVRYEDLTGEGEATVRALCQWLDTPFDASFLDVPHVNPSENPYVLESETRGLNRSRIYQYVDRLKPHEVAQVDQALRVLGARDLAAHYYPQLPHEMGEQGLMTRLRAWAALSVAPLRYAWVYLTFLKRSPRHILGRTWRRLRG